MKITKCDGCLKRYDHLYEYCPIYKILGDGLATVSNALLKMKGKHFLVDFSERENILPKEFLDYDFKCKYYSPKPKTVEAFL